LVLSGNNSAFTGNLTINGPVAGVTENVTSPQTVKFGSTTAGIGGNVVINGTQFGAAASDTLDLNGFSNSVGALIAIGEYVAQTQVTNSGASATLTIGNNNASGTFAGSITDSGAGKTLSLVKAGTGTETFSGSTNTYIGTTTVNAGTLIVSGAVSGTPTVNVNAGTLQVSKSGLYTNAINSAATLSLGATAAATFAMSNDGTNNSGTTQSSQTFSGLTLGNTASIDFGSNTTGDGNALLINGNVTLTTFTSLAVLDWSGAPFATGATTDPGTTLTQDDLLFASSSNVLTAFGNIALGTPDSQISFYNDAGTFLGNGEFVTVAGGTYSGDIELVATAAVPEPGTWAMMLAGMGMLVVLQRRRRV
jgi:autotransporter-associated beta strand protein